VVTAPEHGHVWMETFEARDFVRTGLVLSVIAFAGARRHVLALARLRVRERLVSRFSLSVVFVGSGGAGAMTAGAVFLRAAAPDIMDR
jgi:hypothetical protein